MGIKKFDQIDGLRFIAVFAVVCSHWLWSGTKICETINSASRGVDLFFVISGFLITLGLIRSKEKTDTKGRSLYKFYIRRFLRIFPVYYLTVFVLLLFYYDQMAGSIWWYLLYLCNFHSIITHSWGVGGHLWSLSVEEQFYLVWPFIILFISARWLPLVMIASIALSLGMKTYWTFQHEEFWMAYMNPIGALDTLAIGALLAYMYHFHQERLKAFLYYPLTGIIATAQMIICLYLIYVPDHISIHHIGIRTSFGLFAAWLIGRAAFGFKGVPGYILEARPLLYIGKISYAIYLFHPFVPGMLLGLKYPEDIDLRFLLEALVTILMASVSWYFFESRILKLKERFE